jgi:hypothetical protein
MRLEIPDEGEEDYPSTATTSSIFETWSLTLVSIGVIGTPFVRSNPR